MKSIAEIRRDNLNALLRRRFNGNVAAMAKAMGKEGKEGFVHRLLSATRRDRRNLGSAQARDIEGRLGELENSLDSPTGAAGAPIVAEIQGNSMYGMEAQLVGIFRALSGDGRDALMGAAGRIYLREHPEKGIANPFPSKPMPTDPAPSPRPGPGHSPRSGKHR